MAELSSRLVSLRLDLIDHLHSQDLELSLAGYMLDYRPPPNILAISLLDGRSIVMGQRRQ